MPPPVAQDDDDGQAAAGHELSASRSNHVHVDEVHREPVGLFPGWLSGILQHDGPMHGDAVRHGECY